MTILPEEFRHHSVPERIALAQALWDSIADQPRPPLSEAKRAELARRAAEDDARPDDVVPWEKAKADILARLGRP
jgi:putative addiction module component (TIGR02574 family)